MNKIIIKTVEKPEPENPHKYAGSIWEYNGMTCMLVQCHYGEFVLVSLETGNRIKDPQTCLSKITEDATLIYRKATIAITEKGDK